MVLRMWLVQRLLLENQAIVPAFLASKDWALAGTSCEKAVASAPPGTGGLLIPGFNAQPGLPLPPDTVISSQE